MYPVHQTLLGRLSKLSAGLSVGLVGLAADFAIELGLGYEVVARGYYSHFQL